MRKILIILGVVFFALTGQTCSLTGGNVGVFRSIDGGRSWQSINDLKVSGQKTDNPPAQVFSLAVDPTKSDAIYVGTVGRGIYETHDGGRVWRKINNGITLSGSNPVFYDLAVDPKNGDNIFAAGLTQDYGKIFKSTDAGNDWREIFVESQTGVAVTSLAISRTNPKIVLAGSQSGNVYATTDAGESWQLVGSFENQIVSVGISNNNNNVIYVATQALGAFRSDNFGDKWEGITSRVGQGKLTNIKINPVPISRMAVAPTDGNTLYLGTQDGIVRSVDGGRSWKMLSTLLPKSFAPSVSDIKVSFQNPDLIYFSVPNVVYKAENKGNKWVSFQVSVSSRVNKIGIDPQNPNIIWAGAGK